MSLGEGFGVGFRLAVGGGFPVENQGKGEGGGERGGGGGVGTGEGTGNVSQCASFIETTLQQTTL